MGRAYALVVIHIIWVFGRSAQYGEESVLVVFELHLPESCELGEAARTLTQRGWPVGATLNYGQPPGAGHADLGFQRA